MEQSILKSTKKVLQIAPDDESFDLDIMIHINSAFSTLNDLGVGPDDGFTIEDEYVEWNDFLTGDAVQLNRIKTFVVLHCRLLFDPPATGFLMNAVQEQLNEVTWRLNVKRETAEWSAPDSTIPVEDEEVAGGFGP
jgi:hypothetical protein